MLRNEGVRENYYQHIFSSDNFGGRKKTKYSVLMIKSNILMLNLCVLQN